MTKFKTWRDGSWNVVKVILFLIYGMKRSVHWKVPKGKIYLDHNSQDFICANMWCYIVVGCNNSGTKLLQRILEETKKTIYSLITANNFQLLSSYQRR